MSARVADKDSVATLPNDERVDVWVETIREELRRVQADDEYVVEEFLRSWLHLLTMFLREL